MRSAILLLYFNVYLSMADKQLKRRLYFLCYCCFYTQYGNEKDTITYDYDYLFYRSFYQADMVEIGVFTQQILLSICENQI